MITPRQVRAQPLTPQAFAPFGEIIDPQDRPPDIETTINRYWDGVTRLECRSRAIQVGFVTAYQRPLRADWMERHLEATQAFIPLEGRPSVFVLSPPAPGPRPDLTKVAAFLLDGRRGVNLHVGTWHHLIFPLVPEASYVMILREASRIDDMHVVDLRRDLETEVEVLL
jgi:ureidoglycolate lyase